MGCERCLILTLMKNAVFRGRHVEAEPRIDGALCAVLVHTVYTFL